MLWCAGPAAAMDFAKIDRRVAKEPAYKHPPLYCLALIGPEGATRVWMVLDGDRLYVDKNCNGDLTDDGPPGELSDVLDFFGNTKVSSDGGKTVYQIDVGLMNRPALRDPSQEPFNQIVYVSFPDGRQYGASGDQLKPLRFAAKPQDAPVLHFGGDLRMGFCVRQPLRKDHEGFKLMACVGTPGSSDGAWVHLMHKSIPKQLQPRVVLEFAPEKSVSEKARVELVLRERCCGCLFHDLVHVPDPFGPDRVKVTLSFSDWTEGRVTAAGYEIDPPVAGKR
jgi:hypothetical protein